MLSTRPTSDSGEQQRPITAQTRPEIATLLLRGATYPGTVCPGIAPGTPPGGSGGGVAVRRASANSGKLDSGFQGAPSKLARDCALARPVEIHSRIWSEVTGPYSRWSPPTILYMPLVYKDT